MFSFVRVSPMIHNVNLQAAARRYSEIARILLCGTGMSDLGRNALVDSARDVDHTLFSMFLITISHPLPLPEGIGGIGFRGEGSRFSIHWSQTMLDVTQKGEGWTKAAGMHASGTIWRRGVTDF